MPGKAYDVDGTPYTTVVTEGTVADDFIEKVLRELSTVAKHALAKVLIGQKNEDQLFKAIQKAATNVQFEAVKSHLAAFEFDWFSQMGKYDAKQKKPREEESPKRPTTTSQNQGKNPSNTEGNGKDASATEGNGSVKVVDTSVRVANIKDIGYTDQEFFKVLDDLAQYLDTMTKTQIVDFYDQHAYQTFNKNVVLKTAIKLLGKVGVISLALLVSQQGSNLDRIGEKTIDMNGTMTRIKDIKELRQRKNQGVGPYALTPQRVAACVPEITAYFLMKTSDTEERQIPQRFPDIKLPGWLQFPAALGIKLDDVYDTLAREWNRRFSALLTAAPNVQMRPTPQANLVNAIRAAATPLQNDFYKKLEAGWNKWKQENIPPP